MPFLAEPSVSFLEEFDAKFYSMLHQRGSMLMDAVTNKPVQGASDVLRQCMVGDAYDVIEAGGITQYAEVQYDQRIIVPKGFECPIMFDKYDLIRQGTPNIDETAQYAADNCGKKIDQIIIDGMWGPAKVKSQGTVPFDPNQIIRYDDKTFVDIINTPESAVYGFNTGKLVNAVQMLRSAFNSAYIGCIASNYALTSLRSDPRCASVLFNTQPALASGQETPYGGVDFFRASECVPKNIKSQDGKHNVEIAFVYAVDKIILGCSHPLDRISYPNAERGMNYSMLLWGVYGAVRMEEKGIVAIEITKEKVNPA